MPDLRCPTEAVAIQADSSVDLETDISMSLLRHDAQVDQQSESCKIRACDLGTVHHPSFGRRELLSIIEFGSIAFHGDRQLDDRGRTSICCRLSSPVECGKSQRRMSRTEFVKD